jgi:uncharacterized membrane protein
MNWLKISGFALALVQVALIAAKLTGGTHWSWLSVLTPLWLPIVAAIVIAIIAIALFSGASGRGENLFQ